MSDTDSDFPNLIDRSVKRLFRDQPYAALRLAGIEAATVRFEDSNLNIPELRADHVFIVEEEGNPTPYALYLEYQQFRFVPRCADGLVGSGGIGGVAHVCEVAVGNDLPRGDNDD